MADPNFFTTPTGIAVIAASSSFVAGLLGAFISSATIRATHRQKIEADENLADRKFDSDRQLASRRFDFDKELAERKFTYDKELTEQKLRQDKESLVHRRRFELAESVLGDAYRFRDLMAYVRNGAAFGSEGDTRKSEEYEAENIRHSRNVYFVPIERLQKESEFISGMMAKQFAARAHFGPDASRAFALFAQSVQRVQVAAGMLIKLSGQESNDLKLTEDLRKDIWAPLASLRPGGDEVKKQIEEAVSLIEAFCVPVLTWKGA
jgi:hypothetical protein